jgi:hypothetical protein
MGTKLVAAAFVASIVPASVGARAADLVPPPLPIGYEEAGPVVVERPVEYRIMGRSIVVAPGPAYDEPDDDEYYSVDEPY